MEQTKVSVQKVTHEKTIRASLLRTNLVALILFSLSVLVFAAGCASFDRSNQSGYYGVTGSSQGATASSDRRAYERQSAQSELSAAASEKAIAYRQMLKRQEKMIEGRSEREQYYKAKPYLRNDVERLQFLQLDSTAARDRFLNSRGINGDQITHPPEMQAVIEQNDIAIGMTRQAVKDSWGPADDVDVAGNPLYGNEKWHYSEQTTSRDGYMTEHRTVIFEGGRVVGWETH